MKRSTVAAVVFYVLSIGLASMEAAAQTATTGARSEAMGGTAMTDTLTNASIFANPAAMGEVNRYSIDFGYLVDKVKDVQILNASIVDTITSVVGAGFSYTYYDAGFTRAEGLSRVGHRFDLALSYRFAGDVLIGAGVHYLNDDVWKKPKGLDAASADAGLFYRIHPMASASIVGYNLVDVRNKEAPLALGTGVSVGREGAYVAKFDWVADFSTDSRTSYQYRAGAEYIAGAVLPLRAGYLYDDRKSSEMPDASYWSAGTGIFSERMALEFAYRQAISGGKDRQLTFGLRMIVM